MKNVFSALLIVAVLFTSCTDKYSDLKEGLYAEIETSKGKILLNLEYEKAPVTVANFVTLAEGKNTFVKNELKGKPFYDGLKFHRVINDFMIQGGDPDGTGSGDTGYKFIDEITDLKHTKGVLSMANSGPATNSSQFFITHVETPWLNGLHTVFGNVVEGMETVNSIQQDDIIQTVKIIRVGERAKKFNAIKIFSDYFAEQAEKGAKQSAMDLENKRLYTEKYKTVLEDKVAYFEQLKTTAKKTNSGLRYVITNKGSGEKPVKGTPIFIHYAGYFENGEVFDSSIESVAQAFGKYDAQRAAAGGYNPIPFTAGNKRGMIPGFIEGIEKLGFGDTAVIFIPSSLAYGAQGAGGVIPPNTDLIFEITLQKEQQ